VCDILEFVTCYFRRRFREKVRCYHHRGRIVVRGDDFVSNSSGDKSAAISQLNIIGVPDLSRDNMRQVQDALQVKGFDPGPIDGVAGSRTKVAIRKFQDRFGMKASGEIDNQTLFALGKVEFATGH
jgi:peptidoglycan hydrolase-like protein with peptidoglycan-binding domain